MWGSFRVDRRQVSNGNMVPYSCFYKLATICGSLKFLEAQRLKLHLPHAQTDQDGLLNLPLQSPKFIWQLKRGPVKRIVVSKGSPCRFHVTLAEGNRVPISSKPRILQSRSYLYIFAPKMEPSVRNWNVFWARAGKMQGWLLLLEAPWN